MGIRVIAGTAKGQRLKVPKLGIVRPATDLVRGAIFSILENIAKDWSLVLDLFSGSGAMGIEALSRGAGWVDFVERERRCCNIIEENLEQTRLADRAHIYCCAVSKAIGFLEKEYSIVIMDPPYADSSIGNVITQVGGSKLVGTKTIIVVTHSPHLTLEATYGALRMFKEHRHGDSCIAVYKKEVTS